MSTQKAKNKHAAKKASAKKLLKNPFFYVAIVGIIVLAIVATILIILNNQNQHVRKIEELRDSYIYLGSGHDVDSETSAISDRIVTDYSSYQNAIQYITFANPNATRLTKSDFDNHNYAIVVVRYDECSEDNLEPSELTATTDQVHIVFDYDSTCGLCAAEYLFYAFKLDKNITNADIVVDYHTRSTQECDENVVLKPIIYLYPTQTTNISIELGYPELISTSYPRYQDGWRVTAEPSGKLTDQITGRELYALYWEGKHSPASVQEDGFVVSGSETAAFLESKLAILGLNEREAEEFIVFWLPKMEHNKYNYIRFATPAEIDNYMPLTITPKPDTTIRIYMTFKALDEPINITEQTLNKITRSGYTAIEWGGTEMK